MKRVATAVVLIPLVLLSVFRAPAWLFIILLGTIALLAANEYLSIVGAYGLKPFRWLTLIMIAAQFAIAAQESLSSSFLHASAFAFFEVVLVTGALVMVAAAMVYSDLKVALPSAALSVFALLYVAFPLLSMADQVMPSDALNLPQLGRFRIFALLLFVWAGDGFAYYIGKGLGRRPMAPRISPKKTWEGAAGSVVGSLVAAVAVWAISTKTSWRLSSPPSVLSWVAAAILVNFAAQVGDLVESMMKRGAGVKDSGSLLPGHGGILDRIDALLFAAPVMCYYPQITATILEMFRR